MGCGQSSDQKRSKELDSYLATEGTKFDKEIKLLLLGDVVKQIFV